MLKINRAARRHCGVFRGRVGRLFRFAEEGKHALRRSGGGLQRVGDGGQLRNRLREVSHILNKRLDIADFDDFFYREVTAENTNNDIA
ncbi:hypothetical protein SDC9_118944 [bioreactor metagenome]|uniref:Uncharacterized protein n=1 Tax=bioreactor metagenome TaxID=1076179 RepID=A0A645C2U7_9ZZZZ